MLDCAVLRKMMASCSVARQQGITTLTPYTLYLQGKGRRCPLNRLLVGPLNPSVRFEEENLSPSPTGNRTIA